MPKYQVSIGKDTYEIESAQELTDRQAYDYAVVQAKADFNASGMRGYADAGLQQTAQFDPSTVPAGDKFQPVPAAGPAAPERANPISDPELARMQNAAGVFAATGDQTARSATLANDRSLKDQVDALKAKRDEIYRTRMVPAEKASAIRDIQAQIAAVEDKMSSDPYSTIGGTAGAVVGGVAGAATGPVGGLFGSMAGGFTGTLIGALKYAHDQKMTPQERTDYLYSKGIESLAYDAVGNIVFMGGGKILGKVAKDTAAGRWIIKTLGGDIKPVLKAPREIIRPGERVFGGAKGTTADELLDAAEGGAQMLSSPTTTPSKGQLTGDPGLLEGAARAKDPGAFDAARRAQEDSLEARINEVTAKVRGNGSEFSGTDLRSALDDTEKAVKNHLKPVWEELKQMRGKDAEIVDFREISAMAREMLELNSKAKVKTLTGEKLDWVRKLAGGEAPAEAVPYTFKGAEVLAKNEAEKRVKKMAKLSAGEAQDVLTKMLAIARDAQSPTAPNGELGAFATSVATKLRGQLDEALSFDPKFGEARELYRKMMDVLYDDTLNAARRGGESAAGRKAIKMGEVEGVQSLEKVRQLARQVDQITGSKLAGTADAAHRGAVADWFEKYAGTPDAMARLHQQMGNPDFRKTFEAVIDPKDRKVIEMLSQAAQIAQRAKGAAGSFGIEAAAGSAGRAAGYAVGAPNAGSLVARLTSVLVSRSGAKAFTTPELKAELPRVAAWLLHSARGGGRAAADAPQFVIDFYDRLQAEPQ